MAFPDLADRARRTAIKVCGRSDVTYTPSGGSPITITAVFDQVHMEVDPGTGAVVQSTQPTLGIDLADLPQAPGPGDTWQVDGVTYNVTESQPDGQGGATLLGHQV